MNELQQWTPADDEVVRSALNSLRLDAEALPLADVRFVKARGAARRRRALVIGAASTAAAVAVLGFVGFNTLGSNQGLDLPPAAPTTTTTNTAAPNTTAPPVPLTASGPQLAAAEWQRALAITRTVQLGDMRSGEGVSTCLRDPGTKIAMGFATTKSSGFYAVQGTYGATSPGAGGAAATTAVSQLLNCQQPGEHWKVEADASWPKVLSSATADGKSWFIVAHRGALTSLIALSDPAPGVLNTSEAPHFSLAQIQALALVAQQRLVQEVEGTNPPSASSTP